MAKRKIDDVLDFRSDLSPFLVHLTRNINGGNDAKTALESIINSGNLEAGDSLVSFASYGVNIGNVNGADKKKFFGATCFTETPLNEIHCLLEVSDRSVELEPYGLVFIKDKMRLKGVSPVLYLNNEQSDKTAVLQALCSLMNSHPTEAAEILPLVSFFGSYVTPPGFNTQKTGKIDFLWEREWRYPANCGALPVAVGDVFLGICPHDEIDHFEALFAGVDFVDPRRNLKWYATKLVAARKRLGLSCSVV